MTTDGHNRVMLMESTVGTTESASATKRRGGRFRVDHARTMASEFMHWWRDTLMSCVPARLSHYIVEPRLLAEATAGEVCIYRPDRKTLLDRVLLFDPVAVQSLPGEDEIAGKIHGRCDVILDRTVVLESTVTLPLEAERELRRVLSFSMDRYTPFRIEDVYFDYQVVRRDVRNRTIDVVLYVAPRKIVDAIVARLLRSGLATVTVDIATAPLLEHGDRLHINMLPTKRRSKNAVGARLNLALVALAVTLLFLALAIPLWHRYQAAVRLDAEISRLLPEAKAAESLLADLDERLERAKGIYLRKSSTPAVLEVLLEITRMVPDDAWVGQVEIKNGRVRLTGEAVEASEMVQTLTASGYFSDPRFEAPLTQNSRNERDRFVISLAVQGHGH